ncbi:MAG: NAD(P)-dependent dehydrogenase (short-subunit alcohol dehydrogenase family) [Candidatus Pelagisphaera sp.]|jgi:NAD(P)-dependent dehydrogenase (short-subunit alcohol dehydrogenase family)
MNNGRLKNKVVLVTGGNTGIGRAIAERCLKEGASVAVHGLDKDAVDGAASEMGPNTFGIAGDFENADTPSRIVDEAVERFGRLDGVVNNAAIITRASFCDTSAVMFDQTMAINVRAPFLICQASVDHLKKTGGCVVNIGSINAHGGEGILSAYSASKGALQTMSRNLAEIHAKDGIRFTHLNLGWVLSDTEYERKLEDGLGDDWPSRLDKGIIPSGKMTQPSEVASVVAFWLSDESRPFSGTVLDVEQYPFLGRNPTKDEDYEMG